jgi:hypothetical protein
VKEKRRRTGGIRPASEDEEGNERECEREIERKERERVEGVDFKTQKERERWCFNLKKRERDATRRG